jgi:hypothetical protein
MKDAKTRKPKATDRMVDRTTRPMLRRCENLYRATNVGAAPRSPKAGTRGSLEANMSRPLATSAAPATIPMSRPTPLLATWPAPMKISVLGAVALGASCRPQRVQDGPGDHAVPYQSDGDEHRLVTPWHVYPEHENGVRGRSCWASSQTVEVQAVSR